MTRYTSVQREQRETKYRTGLDPCSLPAKSGESETLRASELRRSGCPWVFSPRTAVQPTRGFHRCYTEILGSVVDVWKGDAGIGWARRNATSPTIRYRTTISTPVDIDMSLPHSIAGPSKKRKHSSAESGDKGVGLGGIDPANLDGPQPAPAYRDRSQGQKFDDTRKVLFLSTF